MQKVISRSDFRELTGRTGILGGTFDPIQNAHLIIAERALNFLNLSQVIFIPAFLNPLKSENSASPQQRLKMLEIALSSYPDFHLSDLELLEQEPSFTWNTIQYIKAQTDAELFFISGSDCLNTLHQWYEIHSLLETIPFCIAARGKPLTDTSFAVLDEHFSENEILRLKAQIILGDPIHGSATEVRELFKRNEIPEGLLPQKVIDYILEQKLYC